MEYAAEYLIGDMFCSDMGRVLFISLLILYQNLVAVSIVKKCLSSVAKVYLAIIFVTPRK